MPNSADRYVAVFNLANGPRSATIALRDAGITAARAAVRDLWSKTDLSSSDSVRVPMLAPHASVLYRLSPR